MSDNDLLGFLGYDSERFCPDTLHVNTPVDTGQIAEVTTRLYLSADNVLQASSTTTFMSGGTIELLPGFQVDSSAVFTARIGGCN